MYVECDKCDGTGLTRKYHTLEDIKTGRVWIKTRMCFKCHGDGKLDWIENILGKSHDGLQIKLHSHPTTKWGEIDVKVIRG